MTTDELGRATATYTAPSAGENASFYFSSLYGSQTFSITVTEPIVQVSSNSMAIYSGNGQNIAPLSTSAPLAVKVANGNGVGLSGVVVTFSKTSGAGSISNTSVTTDSNGLASIDYIAPSTNEYASIFASSSAGSATFAINVGGINYPALSFTGLTSATALDNTSIKLVFPLASGGSGLYSYRLYQTGNYSTVLRYISVSQITVEAGANTFIVTGLTPSTTYNFVLRVDDSITLSKIIILSLDLLRLQPE